MLVLNEIIDLAEREKKSCMFLKLDFEKIFDCVGWDFLRYMLKRLCFGSRWMEACVFNSNMFALVNESPAKDFMVSKGLRQLCPLSPVLFSIVIEGLAWLLKKTVGVGNIHGFRVSAYRSFRIFLFAEDTIVLGGSS